MHARTLYNITRTRVPARANGALAALAVLLLMSCASNGVIDEINEIDANGKDPMNFTCIMDDSETTHNAPATRAAQPLTTGFMVSTFKAYNSTLQHTVMDCYNVEYKTSGTAWDGNVRPYWDYTGVSGQYEKFWDYSAFPYRFHAISPYPANTTGFVLSGKKLTIPATYTMQSSHNGMVTPANDVAEPHLVAQVQRDGDGRDYDHLAVTHPREINTGSQTRNRYVALPFHHLNSKVRFGIYCTSLWTTANPLYIEGLSVRVCSRDFVTQANGYSAEGATDSALGSTDSDNTWYIGTGNSGFQGLTQVTDLTTHTELLRFDGGKDVPDNDLSLHQGRSSAYWLQCPGGIMQIPQQDVILMVSLKLMRMDGTLYKEFTDVPIRMEDGTLQYNWLSGCIHTYYLIIGDIDDKLEISFTATLTPWEDVSGSLSTDLEQ